MARAILQVGQGVSPEYPPGVYEIVESKESKAGEITRAAADELLEAHPDSVREFKDNEPIGKRR